MCADKKDKYACVDKNLDKPPKKKRQKSICSCSCSNRGGEWVLSGCASVSVAEEVLAPVWKRGVEAVHEELLLLVFLGFVQARHESAGLFFSRLANSEVEPVGLIGPVNL